LTQVVKQRFSMKAVCRAGPSRWRGPMQDLRAGP